MHAIASTIIIYKSEYSVINKQKKNKKNLGGI
jgi:hypothetical protein